MAPVAISRPGPATRSSRPGQPLVGRSGSRVVRAPAVSISVRLSLMSYPPVLIELCWWPWWSSEDRQARAAGGLTLPWCRGSDRAPGPGGAVATGVPREQPGGVGLNCSRGGSWTLLPVGLVAVAAGAARTGRRARSRCHAAGHGDLVPHTARGVQPVALGLAGRLVSDVGVERMPVVGGLGRAVRPRDRAERSRQARHGGRWPLYRRPERRTRPVALRGGRGVWREP